MYYPQIEALKDIYAKNTSDYTVDDIWKEVNAIQDFLKLLGIKVNKVSNIQIKGAAQMKKSLGNTCRRNGIYSLSFNREYLEVGVPRNIHSTITHEVIHCIPDGFNHGARFKWYGKIFKQYFGLEISTHSTDENYYNELYKEGFEKIGFNYAIKCNNCGRILGGKQRNSKSIKSIRANKKEYQCQFCKSDNLSIIES